MSVWFCIPSARPALEANVILRQWKERGYQVAVWRDAGREPVVADVTLEGAYPGYAVAVNAIAKNVLKFDPTCQWIVTGGDDTEPDKSRTVERVAIECEEYFKGTFGVMQPTGDRWGDLTGTGAYIDRVAGSPWMGRDFCQRINGGNGPLWPEYFHMGVDEELQAVAVALGVFWQRRELTHAHRHWARENAFTGDMPAFLSKANSQEEWLKYKRLFATRQVANFPGHKPLAESLLCVSGAIGAMTAIEARKRLDSW